jgi:Virulence factor membrane-bound polymerase, C-terminal/O-Antigen ligase/Protein glycosylation ligase
MRLLQLIVWCVLIALPWLNPFANGPSSAMVPWLVSLACVGAVVWAMPARTVLSVGNTSSFKLSRAVWVFFAANAAYFALRTLGQGVNVEAGATLVAWGGVLLMACVGAALIREQEPLSTTDFKLSLPSARALAITWLIVALLSALMGLVQYLELEPWFGPWISHSGDGVAYANLRQRNQFATLCGIGLLALIYLQNVNLASISASSPIKQCTGSYQFRNLIVAAWPWAAAAVLAMGNALSSSRTGALQWLLIAVALLCWRGSLAARARRLGFGALGIYLVMLALMPWFADAVGNASSGLWGRAQENGAPGVGRTWLYSNVLDLIAQKPWLGWGWRELAYAHYISVFPVRFVELLDNAHNLPLHLAVELGTPYAVLFCGAVLVWIARARPWREADATRQLAWGVLLLLGVHSMVEYPLWYGPFLMTLGLCIGLLQPRFYASNQPVAQQNNAQAAIKFAAWLLIILTAYIAYDYHRVSQIYTTAEQRSSLYPGDALAHAQQSVLFQKQARFAELVTTPVTTQTAPRVLQLAAELVHYSPEPRVIEALIESAVMLHFDDVAMLHIARYKAMYPKDYAAWTALK